MEKVIVDSALNTTLKTGQPFARMDILGYSDLMENTPTNKQLEITLSLIIQARFAEQSLKYQPPFYQISGDEILIHPLDKDKPQDYNVRSIVYFLSALLGESVSSLGKIGISKNSSPTKLIPKFSPSDRPVPLRGALSIGDLYVVKEHPVSGPLISTTIPMIILGKSVIKAYKWERAQKWIGASMDPESFSQLKDYAPQLIEDLKKERYLIEWNIPTKDGPIKSLAINFVREGDEKNFKDIIVMMENNQKGSEHKAKYTATRLFIEHVLNNKLVLPERMPS